MLKLIKIIRLQKLQVLPKTRTNNIFSTSNLNNKPHISQPNPKILNVSNAFHTCTANNGKLFYDYENAYAFNFISKDFPSATVKCPTDDVKTLEGFNATLNQNWRDSSASEIVKAFSRVKDYCVQNRIDVSDTRFDKLVDGLMDHCEKLTDEELLQLLTCLVEYPICESSTSHNFHDIWSCLDDICCWKMLEWDIKRMFVFANLWYKLNLGKLADYIFILIDRLTKKADVLNKDELVNLFFYFNICRRRAVDFEFEYALEKHIDKMNVNEMAVIAMGYFKTKTKIKLYPIMQIMAQRVVENNKTIHEISLTAILKILRYSKPTKLVPQIISMLDSLHEEIDRLSHLCCLHVALLGTGLQMPHKKTLEKVSEKIVKDIVNIEKVRLKDIERLLNVLSMLDFDPKTEPDVYKAAYNELHRGERIQEFLRYPRCLPCALNYLSLRNIYSYELMNRVLDIEYINDTYGPKARALPLELFTLDVSIDIECPDYKGQRLPPTLRYKAAKWLTEFIPSYDQNKKITAAEQLFLDTIDAVKTIVKDDQLIYIDHVLPHFSRADIILCKDKCSDSFVQPRGFKNYILGDVKFPLKDDRLRWFAIVILGWNNTIRESCLPLGLMVMKQRQLTKIGYTPVFVIWNEFMRLAKEEKVDYISRKLS